MTDRVGVPYLPFPSPPHALSIAEELGWKQALLGAGRRKQHGA